MEILKHIIIKLLLFSIYFFMFESWTIIPISPNANDHIILVWLKNVPVENGIKLIPNAKQYAKCDISAKISNLDKYFFLLCV